MIINPFIFGGVGVGIVGLVYTGFEGPSLGLGTGGSGGTFLDSGTLGLTWTIGPQGVISNSHVAAGSQSGIQSGGNAFTIPWDTGLDIGSADFEFGCSAYITVGYAGFSTFLMSAASNGGNDAWAFRFGAGYPGTLTFTAYLSGGTVSVSFGSSLDGAPHDFAAVRVGGTLKAMLDGVQVDSVSCSGGFTARGGGYLVLGAQNLAGLNPMSAYFDQVRVIA